MGETQMILGSFAVGHGVLNKIGGLGGHYQ